MQLVATSLLDSIKILHTAPLSNSIASVVCESPHWPAEHHGSSVDFDPALHFVRPHRVHQYPAKPLWQGERGTQEQGERGEGRVIHHHFYLPSPGRLCFCPLCLLAGSLKNLTDFNAIWWKVGPAMNRVVSGAFIDPMWSLIYHFT